MLILSQLNRHKVVNYFSMHNLALPEEIEIKKKLGSGRRSQVYLASYRQNSVVVKAYKPEFIEKYRQRYGVDIGEFEFERNSKAYHSELISAYIAKPYRLLRAEEGFTPALVQEFVDGVWLLELLKRLRYLPEEILEAGYLIVNEAAKLNLYDLDISPGNIQVIQSNQGKWSPKLYDFNLMPQYLQPPNPFMRLGFALGLRSKNHRDYRSLKQWERLGREAAQ